MTSGKLPGSAVEAVAGAMRTRCCSFGEGDGSLGDGWADRQYLRVADEILQAAYPTIVTAIEADIRKRVLGDEAVTEIQRQLSSEGFMLEGHPAYDAAEQTKAQEIIADAVKSALDSAGIGEEAK